MLNKIKLTNFRRHTDLTVNFGAGLTALRAANEGGKSTLLEAVAYALFGVKAIRDSLENVVTWDCPLNTLKVDLDFTIDSVSYTLKRSKASCELNYDGGIVTGQTEVSAFVAKLLKVDSGLAARLTISNQSEIRGALESGTKATTELIERLAEFNQIDNLIELMQEKLTLGSTAAIEAAIDTAQTQFDRAATLAVPVDEKSARAAIELKKSELLAADQMANEAAAAQELAQESHSALRERIVKRDNLSRSLAKAEATVGKIAVEIKRTDRAEEVHGLQGKLDEIDSEIEKSKRAIEAARAYNTISPYLGERADEVHFEGSLAQLQADIVEHHQRLADQQKAVVKLDGDIQLLRSELTHGSCTFCGKDFSGVPEVIAKNSATQMKLDTALDARDTMKVAAGATNADRETLRLIEGRSIPALNALRGVVGFAEQVGDTLPPTIVWVGDTPRAAVPSTVLTQKRAALLAQQRQFEDTQIKVSMLRDQHVSALAERDRLRAEMDCLPVEVIGEAQATLDAARAALADAARAARVAAESLKDMERALKDRVAEYQRAVEAVQAAQVLLDSRKADLVDLEFNNALLKRIRQARPLISDKLWTIVLSAVSSYFSDIRGTKSRITKDSSGFMVDGHPVSSMSGSTLDALGLAIRVALVRTFLPSAPFIILDEPAAAMDGDRTGNMLGFLATCGFGQILMCSHEEVSLDVADHIVSL